MDLLIRSFNIPSPEDPRVFDCRPCPVGGELESCLVGVGNLNRNFQVFPVKIQVEGDRGTGARKNRGRERAGSVIYMRAGSGSRSKEGDTKFLVYYWVLFSQKHLPDKVLKFPFNIHQCLKENFGSKKT